MNTICDAVLCLPPHHGLQSARLLCPWDSPGKNTEVGYQALLQGIFPTQGSNPGLLHCRWILYCLRHQRSPRILEWVAYPFSSGSSQTRNQTRVSCIAGGFFNSWATREAPLPVVWYASNDTVTLQCHLFPKSICMLYFCSISLLPLFTYLFGGYWLFSYY